MSTSVDVLAIIIDELEKVGLPFSEILKRGMIKTDVASQLIVDLIRIMGVQMLNSEKMVCDLAANMEKVTENLDALLQPIPDDEKRLGDIDFKIATAFRDQVTEAIRLHKPDRLRILVGEKVMDVVGEMENEEAFRDLLEQRYGFSHTAVVALMPDIRLTFFTEFPHIPEHQERIINAPKSKRRSFKGMTPDQVKAIKKEDAKRYVREHRERKKAQSNNLK